MGRGARGRGHAPASPFPPWSRRQALLAPPGSRRAGPRHDLGSLAWLALSDGEETPIRAPSAWQALSGLAGLIGPGWPDRRCTCHGRVWRDRAAPLPGAGGKVPLGSRGAGGALRLDDAEQRGRGALRPGPAATRTAHAGPRVPAASRSDSASTVESASPGVAQAPAESASGCVTPGCRRCKVCYGGHGLNTCQVTYLSILASISSECHT